MNSTSGGARDCVTQSAHRAGDYEMVSADEDAAMSPSFAAELLAGHYDDSDA